MTDIVSKQGQITASEQDLYAFLTDFRNLDDLIPHDKVDEWDSTEDQCTIGLPQVGAITLKITEKEPYSLIKVEPVGGAMPFAFKFFVQMKQVAEQDTRIKLTLRAELNMMMRTMFQGPLKKGLDQIIERLEQFDVPPATE